MNQIENSVSENQPIAAPIDQVIAESKSNLSSGEPQPGRPGRRKGQKDSKPRKRRKSLSEPSDFPETAPQSEEQPSEVPEPESEADYTQMINGMTKAVSRILVQTTGEQCAALTEEEQTEIALSLNPVFRKWFPQVSEVTPESVALMGVGFIGFSIWQRIQEAKEKRPRATTPAPNPQEQAAA